jgi:hypothetical protein
VALASVGISLTGCAQLLDIGGLDYRGSDASEEVAPGDAEVPDADAEAQADSGAIEAAPPCDGPCAPTTLVTTGGLEPTIATDGKSVFLRAGTEVESCSVGGCQSPSHVYTTSAATPRLVAASSSRVYWNDGSAVFGCAGAGACGAPTTMMDLGSLALTGLSASLASSWVVASGWGSGNLSVLRAAPDGTSEGPVVAQTIGGGTSGAVVVVPQSSRVYWAEDGAPTIFDCVAPPCASPDHNTNALALSPLGLVATLAQVFFGTTSGLYVADKDLASAKPFAGSGVIGGVVLQPSSEAVVYFVEHAGANWTIESCPTGGASCTPAALHTTTTAVSALAADDASLVWIEGNAVMRMVLP